MVYSENGVGNKKKCFLSWITRKIDSRNLKMLSFIDMMMNLYSIGTFSLDESLNK